MVADWSASVTLKGLWRWSNGVQLQESNLNTWPYLRRPTLTYMRINIRWLSYSTAIYRGMITNHLDHFHLEYCNTGTALKCTTAIGRNLITWHDVDPPIAQATPTGETILILSFNITYIADPRRQISKPVRHNVTAALSLSLLFN